MLTQQLHTIPGFAYVFNCCILWHICDLNGLCVRRCSRGSGRLRLAYSGYSRNCNIISGLRCARNTTRVIELISDDRDHGDKPRM